jgi:pimeloyl-ACP methyl ester carboxylesterase
VDVAPTRYVDTDRGAIAYQIVGDGPTTILVNKPVNYPIDLMWDEPSFARFLTGLGSFARCIWFDPLGSGASDAIEVIEDRLGDSVVADMLGLLDSLEQERAFVLGVGYAVPSILLTATHPERVQGLVLFNPVARVRRAPDYPQGIPDELIDAYLEHVRMIEDDDSNPLLLQPSPSLDGNVRFARWFRRCERLATTPNHRVFRLRVSFAADVRGVLPSVRVPTLVCVRGTRMADADPRSTSRNAFPARACSLFPARIRCSLRVTRARCSTVSRSSSPVSTRSTRPTGCSRP